MNPIATHAFSLWAYPTATEITQQEMGIPDALRQCAQYLVEFGAGQARFCVGSQGGALFTINGYYLSILSDGTLLDGEDVLREALTAAVIAAVIADPDDAQDDAPCANSDECDMNGGGQQPCLFTF